MTKRLLAAALLLMASGGLLFAKKNKAKDAKDAEAGAVQTETVQAEAAKTEAAQTETAPAGAAKTEAAKAEAAPAPKAEVQQAPKAQAAQAEAARSGDVLSQAAKEAASRPDGESGEGEKVESVKRVGKDVAVHDGLVRMETARASGAVLFYVVNGKKIYPAVKTSEYGQSNYLSVFAGAKEWRLTKGGRCSYKYDVSANSIVETMLVKGVAQVTASYEIGKYRPGDKASNCVRVKVAVTNLAKEKTPLSLKAVYNLCLGENRRAHFSTPLNNAIGSEHVLLPSQKESWIISSDGQNAVEFVVYGKGVTAPKKAVMANKDVIDLATPITLFNPGNSFDSILSYNDSSLALFWDPVELDEGKSVSYSYIINFSDSDFQNSGQDSRGFSEVPQKEDGKEEKPIDDNLLVDGQNAVERLDPEKTNFEYVQQLIDHINSLEQSDPSLNKAKIQQLQTEVDEVLKVLRRGK